MSLWDNILKIFTGTVERPSPSDIVPTGNITHVDNLVTISLDRLNVPLTKSPKVWIPMVPDTNSMDGWFDFGNNNILIAGADEGEQKILIDFIKVGDIAVYQIPNKIYAIHQVIKMGIDSRGRWLKFKGINNPTGDPYLVRDEHIKWLSIGTIY